MGMGEGRIGERQEGLWVAFSEIVSTPGHVFDERLNAVLNAEKFDQRIEFILVGSINKSSSGRPSITPGTYFRMLGVGLLRGNRFGARHRVAGGGQLELPQVPGLRSERANAG